MKTKIPIAVASVGIFLFLLSFVWGFLFPAEKAWTPDKSQALTELSTRVQSLHMKVQLGKRNPAAYGDREPGEVEQEYREVQEKLAAMKQEFEKASTSPQTVANTLRWTGMLSAVIGLVALRALNQS